MKIKNVKIKISKERIERMIMEHEWIENSKGMLLWVCTCARCGALRYGWRWGRVIEYTYPAEQSVDLAACGGHQSVSYSLQLSLFADVPF